MRKDKYITFRVSEEAFRRVKKAAKKRKETVSDYVRSRIEEDITESWIEKTEVSQSLICIAANLDKNEDKNARLVDSIRKEIMKLWEKL